MSKRITNAQAYQIAVALWGKKAAIQDNGPRAASTPEQRAQASARAKELYAQKAEIEKLPGFMDTTTYPDTMTLGEFRIIYRERKAKLDAFRKELDTLRSTSWRRRYSVGTVFTMAGIGSGFSVKGQGDDWRDAFHEAKVTDEQIEQILYPRKVAAKKAVAQLEAQAGAE